jgi:hypothetical protein
VRPRLQIEDEILRKVTGKQETEWHALNSECSTASASKESLTRISLVDDDHRKVSVRRGTVVHKIAGLHEIAGQGAKGII